MCFIETGGRDALHFVFLFLTDLSYGLIKELSEKSLDWGGALLKRIVLQGASCIVLTAAY